VCGRTMALSSQAVIKNRVGGTGAVDETSVGRIKAGRLRGTGVLGRG